ncbi:hypothetical protein [Streptomyces klenkii]|uniref:hypothetical protein n=1 Tax=Streptomyces klenkii TaxID=1420899 RepID=UPI003422C2D2
MSNLHYVWEDDPGAPPMAHTPILRDVQPSQSSLSFDVKDGRVNQHGDKHMELRYWSAVDSAYRTADWAHRQGICAWHKKHGSTLPLDLDAGEQFNARYEREYGVEFFHGNVQDRIIYSCESPDMVSHELGHAILDGLNPSLYPPPNSEVNAFHEAFGDISSMLSLLALPSFCDSVLHETGGELEVSSRLSRVAEQMAWAVRRRRTGSVETHCLRDAANEFYYKSPDLLPPRGPVTELCREEHSFSRIFSASFLEILSVIFGQYGTDALALGKAADHAAKLLVLAARNTPVSKRYFADIAACMLVVDAGRFEGEHGGSLRKIFNRRGIYPLSESQALDRVRLDAAVEKLEFPPFSEKKEGESSLRIPGERYGLTSSFTVVPPCGRPWLVEQNCEADDEEGINLEEAVSFVDALFSQDKVGVCKGIRKDTCPESDPRGHTHEIQEVPEGFVLRRVRFQC